MENIKNILVEKYNLNTYCNEFGNIYADNKLINCVVSSPHEGNDYRYLIRFSTVSAFDRWANSTAIEEFFSTKEEVINYLRENELNIYKQLLEYLSEEYAELEKSWEEECKYL